MGHAPMAEPSTPRLPAWRRSSSFQPRGGSRKSRPSGPKPSVTIFRLARICRVPNFPEKSRATTCKFPLIRWCWECSVPPTLLVWPIGWELPFAAPRACRMSLSSFMSARTGRFFVKSVPGSPSWIRVSASRGRSGPASSDGPPHRSFQGWSFYS